MKKAIAAVLTVVSISVMPVAAEINFYGANGIAARQLSGIRDEIKELSVPLPAPAALQQTKMNWWLYKIRTTCDIEGGKAVGWITNNGSGRIDGSGPVEFHFYDASYKPLGVSNKYAGVSIAPMQHHKLEQNIPGNAAYCALNVEKVITAPERDFWTINNACRIKNGIATGAIFNTTPADIHYRGDVVFTYYDKNSVYVKAETLSASGLIPAGNAEVFRLNMVPEKAVKCVMNPEIEEFSFLKTKTPPVIGSYGWRHANLKAADGTEINVDYNVFRAGDAIMADPLWVNVKNPAFSGGEKVRVVLINSTVLTQSTQTLDLEHAGQGRFTARAGRVWIMQTEASFNQEIAVVVDGKWLTDPVSGSNNFKFRMTW